MRENSFVFKGANTLALDLNPILMVLFIVIVSLHFYLEPLWNMSLRMYVCWKVKINVKLSVRKRHHTFLLIVAQT